jgi:hypothetical protein
MGNADFSIIGKKPGQKPVVAVIRDHGDNAVQILPVRWAGHIDQIMALVCRGQLQRPYRAALQAEPQPHVIRKSVGKLLLRIDKSNLDLAIFGLY